MGLFYLGGQRDCFTLQCPFSLKFAQENEMLWRYM
jgi:hypothetical protein